MDSSFYQISQIPQETLGQIRNLKTSYKFEFNSNIKYSHVFSEFQKFQNLETLSFTPVGIIDKKLDFEVNLANLWNLQLITINIEFREVLEVDLSLSFKLFTKIA